jgi:hypothetical protein
MKIKLLTSVGLGGRVRKAGEEVEVTKIVGNDLIHRKRAVLLDAPKADKTITSEALAPEAQKGRKKKGKDQDGPVGPIGDPGPEGPEGPDGDAGE